VCMVRAAAKMKVAAGCSPETTFNNKLPAKRQQQHSRCLGIWGNFEGALKRDRSVESQRGAVWTGLKARQSSKKQSIGIGLRHAVSADIK